MGSGTARFVWAAVGLLWAGLSTAGSFAAAGEAKEVFKKVSPGVVLIRDMEGHGSGVVLSPDGLIVTNFHVVNTPLPLEVSAEVLEGGKQVSRQFRDVKLVGVHPLYDAALIKVTAPGVQFIPAGKLAGNVPVETADNCYVIGNPAGLEGQALRNSITTGLIGAAEREMEGLTYIQISAAINPGNSGGALCDAAGNVTGIVTFKLNEKEGMGFAIPCSRLKEADFKGLAERKINLQKCIEYEKQGSRFFDIYRQSRDEDEREQAKILAYTCFRLSLAEAPNRAGPYHNVGLMYFEMKEPDLAQAFFARAVELDPNSANTFHMLGIIAVNRGDAATADGWWRRGLECAGINKNEIQGAGSCADNLAVSMIQAKRYGPAAYLACWARRLHDNPDRRSTINGILTEAKGQMEPKLYEEILAKKGDFSFEDMARMLSLKPEDQTISSALPTKRVPVQLLAGDWSATARKLAAGAPAPGPRGKVLSLPGRVTDAAPACGGAYLILQFQELKRLAVVNVAQAKIEKEIGVEAGAVIAAGGKTLVVYSPERKILEKWDLETLQKTRDASSPMPGVVTTMAMGLNNDREAFVACAQAAQELAPRSYGILDLATLAFRPLPNGAGNGAVNSFRYCSFRDHLHIRANPELTAITTWATSHSPTGMECALRGSSVTEWRLIYGHSSYGPVHPSPDGRRVCAGNGGLYDPLNLAKPHNLPAEIKVLQGAMLFPVHGADLYVEVQKGRLVRVLGPDLTPKTDAISLPHSMKPTSWEKDGFTTDRQIWAMAAISRLVQIANDEHELCVLDLLLDVPQDRAQPASPANPAAVPGQPPVATPTPATPAPVASPAPVANPVPPPAPTQESEADKMAKQCGAWFNMADNYERSGMKKQAGEYLQRVVDRYPGSAYAKRAAERLKALGQ